MSRYSKPSINNSRHKCRELLFINALSLPPSPLCQCKRVLLLFCHTYCQLCCTLFSKIIFLQTKSKLPNCFTPSSLLENSKFYLPPQASYSPQAELSVCQYMLHQLITWNDFLKITYLFKRTVCTEATVPCIHTVLEFS